jgi:hypothetical protein
VTVLTQAISTYASPNTIAQSVRTATQVRARFIARVRIRVMMFR